jgi:hypothetical protein
VGAPFSRLLLATEHSEFDSGAEQLAFALARRCALPLTGVLPVVSNPEFEAEAPALSERSDAEASLKAEKLAAMAGRAGVVWELHTRHGPEPEAEIVDEARRVGADLIVIRRRGRRGFLANLLVGEMVGKVAAQAPCSVLIAPRGAQLWQRRVLVGIDPAAADARLLERAAALAAESGLPLRIVCVAASEAERPAAARTLAAAVEAAGAAGCNADGQTRVGRPAPELVAAAREAGADLLVVARDACPRAAPGWPPAVAHKVAGQADCPVLIHVDERQMVNATA